MNSNVKWILDVDELLFFPSVINCVLVILVVVRFIPKSLFSDDSVIKAQIEGNTNMAKH